MNLYVWHETEPVSPNYHPEGALVVIADSLESAREHALERCAAAIKEWTYHQCGQPKWMSDAPDVELELVAATGHEPQVWVHPNVGCC